MVPLASLLILISPAAFASVDACHEPVHAPRADRYEDFYHRRHQIEARELAREQAAAEVRGRGAEHADRVEAARLEYVRSRRARGEDRHAEEAYRQALKERAAQNEAARECFVSQRNRAARGREIPGDAEFGLDE